MSKQSITPVQALEKLKIGNADYLSTNRLQPSKGRLLNDKNHAQLIERQTPFAIVIGCSDSRVPPEIIFSQGIGDLFVIRVAGNIVMSSQFASAEFAVAQFDVPLILVLGHTHCGAVKATIETTCNNADHTAKNDDTNPIIHAIAPVVQNLLQQNPNVDRMVLATQVTHANIQQSMQHLQQGSTLLNRRIQQGKLAIVGGEYSLETGEVLFFA